MRDNKPRITFADLKSALDNMTPEQLAQPVVWEGDERGGYVRHIWIAEEDWVGESSDVDTWVPRSEVGTAVDTDDYKDAEVCIQKGTCHLMVDWP